MKIIEELKNYDFPLKWVNLEYYPESYGEKKEIYLGKKEENVSQGLILLFYSLFGNLKNNIYIFNDSWWDFCIDTWDVNNDEYNYNIDNKSDETKRYLQMLQKSGISKEYSGSCKCLHWDSFLPIVIECITTRQAPYSPIFFDEKNNYFFYFHHSGSIGIYYQSVNDSINKILQRAYQEFNVV